MLSFVTKISLFEIGSFENTLIIHKTLTKVRKMREKENLAFLFRGRHYFKNSSSN